MRCRISSGTEVGSSEAVVAHDAREEAGEIGDRLTHEREHEREREERGDDRRPM